MELLGRGRTAEVFRNEDGHALKLFFAQFPERIARLEEHKAPIVHSLCSAAPAFYGSIQLDGRVGLLYERIDGSPLIDVQSLHGEIPDLSTVARDMAKLHLKIHAAAGGQLPTMLDTFQASIERYPHLSPAGRQRLLDFVAQNDTAQLCHGDLHPENVLRQTDGTLRAIDWNNAYSGHPLCDLERSLYMIEHGLPPGTDEVPAAERPIRTTFAAAYRQTYYGETDRTNEEIWRLLALVGRHAENIPGECDGVEKLIAAILRTHGNFS